MSKPVLNSQYNKGVYSGLVGAGLTVIFTSLADYGYPITPQLQGAVTTFLMMLTAIVVKNRGTGDKT